jgi:C4-type Zn-finger protein
MKRCSSIASWDQFSCPICDDSCSTLVELDADALDEGKVVPLRMACFNCRFTIRSGQLFLSEALLEPQVIKQRSEILKDFGYNN